MRWQYCQCCCRESCMQATRCSLRRGRPAVSLQAPQCVQSAAGTASTVAMTVAHQNEVAAVRTATGHPQPAPQQMAHSPALKRGTTNRHLKHPRPRVHQNEVAAVQTTVHRPQPNNSWLNCHSTNERQPPTNRHANHRDLCSPHQLSKTVCGRTYVPHSNQEAVHCSCSLPLPCSWVSLIAAVPLLAVIQHTANRH